MPDPDSGEIIEIDGLRVPKAALVEAQEVIFAWERGNDFRALREVVKIYRIIDEALRTPSEAGPKPGK